MNKEYQKKIETYYDECNRDYEIVWQLKHSMALHYGYWDANTLTHRQALWNTNYQIARHGQIKSSDTVLDAGCGVGGTSFFLANNIGCKVHGISLSSTQIRQALAFKENNDLNNLTTFSLQNYCHTNFPDNSFDVIVGIESLMYPEVKTDFLKEAFRILKPGGRLITADYFVQQTRNQKEVDTLKKWAKTWAIDDFIYEKAYCNDIKNTGFTNIMLSDKSDNVFPSIKLMHRSYYPGILISKVSNFFGKRSEAQVENSKAGKYQYVSFKQGVWRYKFLLAIKPDFDPNVANFDQFIKEEPSYPLFVDKEVQSDRFPIRSTKGISIRNILKRAMHFYLETGIRNKDKWF